MPANSESQAQPDPDAAKADADSVPRNRAERRAKGKVKQQQHLSVGKINPHRATAAHAQRQYSNRRSGGGGR